MHKINTIVTTDILKMNQILRTIEYTMVGTIIGIVTGHFSYHLIYKLFRLRNNWLDLLIFKYTGGLIGFCLGIYFRYQ